MGIGMARIAADVRGPAVGLLLGLSLACGGANGASVTKGGQDPPSPAPSSTTSPAGATAWSAPIGVPAPSFGVTEEAPAPPDPWSATSTTSRGFTFYYVCPSCAGATDSSNANGYPRQPRDSIPSAVDGPAVVVLD